MKEGTVKKVIHLSGQTDIPTANLVPDHNFHGYGYIQSDDGDEVYFDHAVVAERQFDQLSEGTRVEFEADKSEHHRAVSVAAAAAE